MTLDLFFPRPADGLAALAQVAGELGLSYRLVAERSRAMEIFSISVFTVELDGEPQLVDAVRSWFSARGILHTAA